jgi:hypothetical protein
MSTFHVIALPTEVAAQVRETGKSPRYGHPTQTQTATGYGPCRHCLQTFRIGEEKRVMFTYDPFTGIETVPLPGPIFIHEQTCGRYPQQAGYPEDLKHHAAVLNGYAHGQRLVERALVAAGEDKVAAVEHMLERPDVDYIEVRDQNAGCYDFRIERAGEKVFQC